MSTKPIGIYYEHPDWFRLLFTALDRRNTPYVRIAAQEHTTIPPRLTPDSRCSSTA